MSNSVRGCLDYQVYVDCPKCEYHFDVLEIDDIDCDGEVSNPIFTNKWDKSRCEVVCPMCEHEFEMLGVEY